MCNSKKAGNARFFYRITTELNCIFTVCKKKQVCTDYVLF